MHAGIAASLHLALRALGGESAGCASGFEYHGCAVVDLRCFTEPPAVAHGQMTGEACQLACKDFEIAALFPDTCRCSNTIDAVRPLDEAVCSCDCTSQSYDLDSVCTDMCANKPQGASQVWTRKQLQGEEEPPNPPGPDDPSGIPNTNGRLFPPGGSSTDEPEDVPPEPQTITPPDEAPPADSNLSGEPPGPQASTSGQGESPPSETSDGSMPPEPTAESVEGPPEGSANTGNPPPTGEGDPPEPSSAPEELSTASGVQSTPSPVLNTGGQDSISESSDSNSPSTTPEPNTTLWPPKPDTAPPGAFNNTTPADHSTDPPSRPAQVPESDSPTLSVVPESGHAQLHVPLLTSWGGLAIVAAMIM